MVTVFMLAPLRQYRAACLPSGSTDVTVVIILSMSYK